MVDAKVILEHLTDAIVITDTAGKIHYFNAPAAQHSIDEQNPMRAGMSVQDLCSEENKTKLEYAMEYVVETGQSRVIQLIRKSDRNMVSYLEVQIDPILNSHGALSWLCVAARDITQQKAWEHKAAELTRALDELTEEANAVIFSVDARFYITAWNGICAELTGHEQHQILARPVHYFFNEDDVRRHEQTFNKVLSGHKAANIELKARVISGGEKIFLVNATPRRNSRGQVIGILFVGQDITELSDYRSKLELKVQERTHQLKAALAKERELLAIKNKFVSIASHEFKTPLRAIGAHVTSLRENTNLTSQDKKHLSQIVHHVSRMNELLEDILTLEVSRLPEIKQNLKHLDLIPLLNSIIDEVSTATGNTHRIQKNFDANVALIESDEKLLRNIFLNLLTNAIKFSPNATHVAVHLAKHDGDVTVSIEDKGIGIPPADQERIFDPFTRASNTYAIPGTGLGLSIVKRASDVLGAQLNLLSDPGKGTKVFIRFPGHDTATD